MKKRNELPLRLLHGIRKSKACRHPQVLSRYQGNPLNETLPPILTAEEAARELLYLPPFDPHVRSLPTEYRIHATMDIRRIFQPLTISLFLEQQLTLRMRDGYIDRNPLNPHYWADTTKRLDALEEKIRHPNPVIPTPTGLSVIGLPGVGKTMNFMRILSRYDNVIEHDDLGIKQIPYLYMDCRYDGTVKGLCGSFLKRVDALVGTTYFADYGGSVRTIDDQLLAMAVVASTHCIGLLIIDEIQNSTTAGAMLRFFVELVNTIGLPVVFVGTPKAIRILCGELHQLRRGCGPCDIVWNQMKKDEEWDLLLETFFEYQYVRHAEPLSQALNDILYEETQGIPDFLVKMFIVAQWRAMTTGLERLTPDLIRSMAQDHFATTRPVIQALRTHDLETLQGLEDVVTVDLDEYIKHVLRDINHKGLYAVIRRSKIPSGRSSKESEPLVTSDADASSEVRDESNTTPSDSTSSSLNPNLSAEGGTFGYGKVSPDDRKAKKKSDRTGEQGVRGCYLRATSKKRKDRIATYQMLKEEGHIRPVSEF